MAARRAISLTQPLHCCDEEPSSSSSSSSLNKDDIPCVLFLEGWSPGPLFYLRRALKQWQLTDGDGHDDDNNARSRSNTARTTAGGAAAGHRSGIRILQPSLDMPPVTCTWCCNWRFAVMMTTLFLYIWAARRTCQGVLERHHHSIMVYYQYLALLTLIGLVLLRAIISEVVRTSVRYNLQLCQGLLAKHKNIVLVVGFSWGGAIGAELVAQGILGSYCENSNNNIEAINNNQDNNVDTIFAHQAQNTTKEQSTHEPPAVLLIAPTTSLIASLSILKPYRTDAALRVAASWRQQSTTITTSSTSLLAAAEADQSAASTGNNHHLHRVSSSSPSSTTTALIQVVHAQGDGCFCPHPERWQQQQRQSSSSTTATSVGGGRAAALVEQQPRIGGGGHVDLMIIPDENHIFQHSSTQRTLTDLMFHLLRKKGAI